MSLTDLETAAKAFGNQKVSPNSYTSLHSQGKVNNAERTMRLAIVHTLGGGIISAVDARLAWLGREGSSISPTLVAPKKRQIAGRSGHFFDIRGELPSSCHRDYEQAVIEDVLPALREAHKEVGFDMIDAHDGTALIASSILAKELKIPLVHTIHSHELIERSKKGASVELQAAIDSTDAFFAVSDYIANEHLGILRRPAQVIRNPIPTSVKTRLRKSSQDRVRAIFVGRVEREKGFDLLISAAQSLGKRSNLAITVVGAKVELDLVEEAKRSAVPIEFLGKIDDPNTVFDTLSQHDIFLFPTRKEACSMALLEAMGTGLAIIASDIPPNREVAGCAGLFHACGDAEDLARCILRVVQGEPSIEILGARSAALAQDFVPERVFSELDRAYASLL